MTVPEHMGLGTCFTLEGLVHREPHTLQNPLDRENAHGALRDLHYRGLFTPDGADTTVSQGRERVG